MEIGQAKSFTVGMTRGALLVSALVGGSIAASGCTSTPVVGDVISDQTPVSADAAYGIPFDRAPVAVDVPYGVPFDHPIDVPQPAADAATDAADVVSMAAAYGIVARDE